MTGQAPLFEEVGDPQARRDFDWYPTASWMVAALCRRVHVFDVLEPCVGDGAIVRALLAEGVRVVRTNDVDPSREADTHLDATLPESWEVMKPRPYRACDPLWVVTNFPFAAADWTVPNAVRRGLAVATILRLSWLEPVLPYKRHGVMRPGRASFLAECPPDRLIVLPRHDFKGDGATDSVTSAWFIWAAGAGRGIEIVTPEERDELIAIEARR